MVQRVGDLPVEDTSTRSAVIEKGQQVAERYRLDEPVGHGAMGVVWRARDERLGRTVAIKQLVVRSGIGGLTDAQTAEARRRAMREARIAARLQHRNAIALFDVAEHDGHPCLVMEFLPSRSLSAVLRERGPLPPAEVAEIGAQVASALAAAHAAGVVHRDIKPGNVLLGDNGTVKITDFGISRALDDGTLTTQSGTVAGTPAYLAPEVARGGEPTRASDVFSLGATLYHAVEGAPPFGTSTNAFALLHAVASGNVPPPQRAGLLTPILLGLLRREPEDRPTMATAAAALAGEVVNLAAPNQTRPDLSAPPPHPTGSAPPPAVPHRPPVNPLPVGQPPRSNRNLVIAAVAALLVLAGVIAMIAVNSTPEERVAQPPATSTSQRPPTSSSPTSPPTVSSQAPSGPIDWSSAGQLVIDYYSSDQRWDMLSSNGQAVFGDEAAFRAHWGRYTSLSSEDARVIATNDDGSLMVRVDVSYTYGDDEEEQRMEVRVTRDENGRLVIDSETRLAEPSADG